MSGFRKSMRGFRYLWLEPLVVARSTGSYPPAVREPVRNGVFHTDTWWAFDASMMNESLCSWPLATSEELPKKPRLCRICFRELAKYLKMSVPAGFDWPEMFDPEACAVAADMQEEAGRERNMVVLRNAVSPFLHLL